MEQAIEIDPRTVTPDIPQALADLGFNRVSMGIQDFDHDVQVAINRIQPYAMVETLFNALRAAGIPSINADLIYGLPRQYETQFAKTIEHIIQLKPDRIALYSYAHVPWLKSHQNLIKVDELPTPTQKMALFLASSTALASGGYQAIAMDHFALETDEMAKAYRDGKLYRNFMGYTVKPAEDYIGFGPSAIGHMQGSFAQNVKELKAYYQALEAGTFPIERGMVMSADDRIRQWVIQSFMCQFVVDKATFQRLFLVSCDVYFSELTPHLDYCVREGLLRVSDSAWTVTDLGRFFVRNICMGFDAYFKPAQSENRFSRTV
jgi:oxygen-independent coproporphyrinogen III oxidase